jgi:hypothetical protein
MKIAFRRKTGIGQKALLQGKRSFSRNDDRIEFAKFIE